MQDVAMSELLALSGDLPVTTFAPGQVLIEQGDPPGPLYLLLSGAVTIERGRLPIATVDHPGAVFGEMSVVLGLPATATARAASPVEVRVVADPETFLYERPGAALAVLRITAARLDALTQYLVDVKRRLADEEGHLGMIGGILDVLVHHQGVPTPPSSAHGPGSRTVDAVP